MTATVLFSSQETGIPRSINLAPITNSPDRHLRALLTQLTAMLEFLSAAGSSFPARIKLDFAAQVMAQVAPQPEANEEVPVVLSDLNRSRFLEHLCQQIMSAVTLGRAMNFDVTGALIELQLFEEIKHQGKVLGTKPTDVCPDLSKYV
jgi:hypothetical protein